MEETLGQYLCHMRSQKGVSLEEMEHHFATHADRK